MSYRSEKNELLRCTEDRPLLATHHASEEEKLTSLLITSESSYAIGTYSALLTTIFSIVGGMVILQSGASSPSPEAGRAVGLLVMLVVFIVLLPLMTAVLMGYEFTFVKLSDGVNNGKHILLFCACSLISMWLTTSLMIAGAHNLLDALAEYIRESAADVTATASA